MNAFTNLCRWMLVVVLLSAAAHAQTSLAPAPPESLPIGAGDVVQVSVFDETDLTQVVRVSDAGEIVLNMLGPERIGGLTPFGAAEVVRKSYIDKGMLTNPQVAILVEQSFHRSVSVLGEVAHPGAVELPTPRTLLDVISLAGGFSATADRHVTIRRLSNPTAPETIFLPNDSAREVVGGSSLIYPGDAIIVPKAPVVYVLGDVARPGGYVIQNDSRMTLLQAISLAGGAAHTAAEGRARLLHHGASGYTEQKISLTAYEKGKLPDFELQKDDVIWVPFSYSKNVAIGAGSVLSGTGSALIYNVP